MQKNHHNQIRLSQRNPCKIKVFLGCPYYTAISFKDIPELRELIQRCLPYEPSQTMARTIRSAADDPWVCLHLEHETIHLIFVHQIFLTLFCIQVHTAEFVNLKSLSVLSDPDLREKDRSRRCNVYRRPDKYRKDTCQEQAHEPAAYIHQTLQQHLPGGSYPHAGGQHHISSHTVDILITCPLFHPLQAVMYSQSHIQACPL